MGAYLVVKVAGTRGPSPGCTAASRHCRFVRFYRPICKGGISLCYPTLWHSVPKFRLVEHIGPGNCQVDRRPATNLRSAETDTVPKVIIKLLYVFKSTVKIWEVPGAKQPPPFWFS